MHPLVNVGLAALRLGWRVLIKVVDRFPSHGMSSEDANEIVETVRENALATITPFIEQRYPSHAVGRSLHELDPDAEFRWTIEPLDGSSNFALGYPHHCSAISIWQGPIVHHAIVLDHLRNEAFCVSKGRGALVNDRRARVSNATAIRRSVIGFHTRIQGENRSPSVLNRLQSASASVRQSGCSTLDLAYVACGRLDGCLILGRTPKDLSAGMLLIRESGGFASEVGEPSGADSIDQVAAGNPSIFKQLTESLQDG